MTDGSLYGKWVMSHDELLRRPMLRLDQREFENTERDIPRVFNVPVAFAVPVLLLRQTLLKELRRSKVSFLEEWPDCGPEHDCDPWNACPTPEEFATIMRELETTKHEPERFVYRDFSDTRLVTIYAKVVAVWLLNRCQTLIEGDNALNRCSVKVLLSVIEEVLRGVEPNCMLLSWPTLTAMSKINFLRNTILIASDCPQIPQCVDELLYPTRYVRPKGERDDLGCPEEEVMAAIRCISVGVIQDTATIQSNVIRSLAKFIPYHAIGLLKDYCTTRYRYFDDGKDMLWLRNLVVNEEKLRYVVFQLARRLGSSYFSYNWEFFKDYWWNDLNQISSFLPSFHGARHNRVCTITMREKLAHACTHCFMTMVMAGCQRIYHLRETEDNEWKRMMVHRDGTTCSNLCYCRLQNPERANDPFNLGDPEQLDDPDLLETTISTMSTSSAEDEMLL